MNKENGSIKNELDDIINEFKKEEIIFRNEAQFQFDLAWRIREKYTYEIELEKYYKGEENDNNYTDIVVTKEGKKFAIELKYKLADVETEYSTNSGEYKLTAQGAIDSGSYDFCKDISRVEKLIANNGVCRGYAIIIANHPGYWGKRVDGKDCGNVKWDAFRLKQGKTMNKTLKWEGTATSKEREKQIVLQNKYVIDWIDYKDYEKYPFKYLIVEIPSKKE